MSLGEELERLVEEQTAALALELGVVGLMNVQYALQQNDETTTIFVLEVNPTGQPHGALRQQGHRRAPGPRGHQGHRGTPSARP